MYIFFKNISTLSQLKDLLRAAVICTDMNEIKRVWLTIAGLEKDGTLEVFPQG